MDHNGNAFVWGVLVSSVVSLVSFPTAIMAQNPPTLEQQRAQDAERARQAQNEGQVERRYDDRGRPGEMYVAGFGGYTIGHGFDNVEGTGALSGINLGDIDLKNSGVYGAKIGYFMPRRLNWLGLEMEAFNTTPHLKETAFTTGAHLRVTTLAFNAIARAKMMCERHDDHDRRGRPTTERDSRDHDFCRLQPYAGVGLGVFFARLSDATGSSSDNAVPGLNALAGVRYFLTERVALGLKGTTPPVISLVGCHFISKGVYRTDQDQCLLFRTVVALSHEA